MLKNTHTLQLWFSGQRIFGDFLVEWCSAENSLRSFTVRTLAPPAPCVAILPDDIIAVQELHMTREGIDTESICLQCKSKGMESAVSSALHQLCGNPSYSVCFFCPNCHSVQNRVALDELPLCPVPWKVWQSLRKIPPDTAPFLCQLILKLWKSFQTSCSMARAAVLMASHENTARMALSSFGNGTEQLSIL